MTEYNGDIENAQVPLRFSSHDSAALIVTGLPRDVGVHAALSVTALFSSRKTTLGS
jgi:hypothetical protein